MLTRLALTVVAGALMLSLGVVPSAARQAATGLTGKVLRGPVSPVCRPDSPCYVPFKGTLVFTRAVGISGVPATKRAQTSGEGVYRVLLPPGRYSVKMASRLVPSKFGSLDPTVAVVPKTGVRRLNFRIDTGIR